MTYTHHTHTHTGDAASTAVAGRVLAFGAHPACTQRSTHWFGSAISTHSTQHTTSARVAQSTDTLTQHSHTIHTPHSQCGWVGHRRSPIAEGCYCFRVRVCISKGCYCFAFGCATFIEYLDSDQL